jgi:hypothetical protein
VLGLTALTLGTTALTTVTEVVAVTAVSATEVAVRVTTLGEGTADGAVYTPLASIVPTPVRVAGTDQVTFRQLGLVVVLQPGLFTVAVKVKCSPVPMVAVVGSMATLIPETMVRVAVPVLVLSACDVAVIVAVGAMVVAPLEVVVGIVFGAV